MSVGRGRLSGGLSIYRDTVRWDAANGKAELVYGMPYTLRNGLVVTNLDGDSYKIKLDYAEYFHLETQESECDGLSFAGDLILPVVPSADTKPE